MEVSIQSSTEIVQKQYAVSLLLLTYSESSGALTTNYGSAAVLFETLKQANHLPSSGTNSYITKTCNIKNNTTL